MCAGGVDRKLDLRVHPPERPRGDGGHLGPPAALQPTHRQRFARIQAGLIYFCHEFINIQNKVLLI